VDNELEDAASSSPSGVDPSKLSVKEKALLAQKALMATPEKGPKPGPPRVARKPKPIPGAHEDVSEEGESIVKQMRRAQSVDDEIRGGGGGGGSPPHPKKKLPPGAINMFRMGAVPMFGPAPDRERSATVSTSDPIARERNSQERQVTAPGPLIPEREEEEVEEGEDGTDAPVADVERSPIHAVQEIPARTSPDDSDAEILDESESPQVPSKFNHSSSDSTPTPASGVEFTAEVDNSLVLTWSPEVTASWLCKVGLGSHGQTFLEKEIHGYLLFDMDGSKLKVSLLCVARQP
jgi:hypothetical protein